MLPHRVLTIRVLTLALLVGCAGAPLEPFDESEHPAPLVGTSRVHGECPRLRALTFNAFSIVFHHNHDEMTRLGAAAVVAENADIVAIQEVWLARDAAIYAEALHAAGLIYQIEHTTDLALARGSSGLLLASRFPIRGERYVPFRTAAVPYWMWPPDWYASKGVLEVIIETASGAVRVLNTHIHADYERGGYLRERLGQSMELAALMRERAELPVLVLGDMNSQPDEVSHAAITHGTGAEVLARANVDLILARDGEDSTLQVDAARFALVHRVRLASGVWSRLSDHAGVFAEVDHCPPRNNGREGGILVREVEGAEAILQEAAGAARLQALVARGLCAALCLILVVWMGRIVWRQRHPTPYETTLPLLILWLITWTIYQGWLAAPQQLAAYEALLR